MVKYSGKELSIGLNVKFFMDALEVFEKSSDEMILLKIKNHQSPIILQCDEWPDYKNVLLPVKIKW